MFTLLILYSVLFIPQILPFTVIYNTPFQKLFIDSSISVFISLLNGFYPLLEVRSVNLLSMWVIAIFAVLFLVISLVAIWFFIGKKAIAKRVEGFIEQIDCLKTELSEDLKTLSDKEEELDGLRLQIGNLQEIVDKYRAEYENAMRIAEEADLLKTNFLANMSHEIRAPMNGILGFAQILQSNDLDKEKQQRYLDIICHNGNMLVNLIDDIMDIAKIEAGQLSINKSEVNLDNLIFELYTFFNEIKFKQEKEHLNIRILNINDGENNVLITDGSRVRQVIANLVGNSIKFTDSGTIEFGYVNNVEESHIQFFVRDTGIGIAPDKLDLIFDRFRQAEEGMTRKYGGTGIGLFISKYIVNLLGGKIWVDSQLSNGTTFYFTIPYETMQQTVVGERKFFTSKPQYNWQGRVIVIAEDVDTNYLLLKSILADTHAQIFWARDGEEVINICEQSRKVDVVLMDIQMPKINGYDATAIIKNKFPGIIVIAQTAYAMPNDNVRCFEAGCDDYISKPINSTLLLQKIDSHLSAKVR